MQPMTEKEKVINWCNERTEENSGENESISQHEKQQEFKFSRVAELEILKEQYNSFAYKVLLVSAAFLCGFGYCFDMVLRSVYTSYATNSYSHHSLLSTILTINAVITVAAQIVFARLSDYFGRLHLFLVAILSYVMGTVIQSKAYNVQIYAAGAVFYTIGSTGVFLLLILMMSDFSSQRWRLLYQNVPTWPFIIIVWVSGNVISVSNPTVKWSWDIAMWAFIFPLSATPLICCIIHMYYKASKTEDWKVLAEKGSSSKYKILARFKMFFWKLDMVGLFILTVCLGCILVPLTLAGGSSEKWEKSQIIGTLALGGILTPIFLLWEMKFAKFPMITKENVKDRGIWAPLINVFFDKFAYAVFGNYLYPVLLVSFDESALSATRIYWLPTFVTTLISPVISILVAKYRKIKFFSVCGSSLWLISMGLFYRYRGGKESHAGIIGGSVVLGVGASMGDYLMMIAVQSMTTHSNMAAMTGLYYAVVKVGEATGAAVSGAIWTQKMYPELLKQLRNETLAFEAYSSPYTFIAKYSWGTVERAAAVEAYRFVQRLIVIVALSFTGPMILAALLMKDNLLTDAVARETEASVSCLPEDKDFIRDFFQKIFKKS